MKRKAGAVQCGHLCSTRVEGRRVATAQWQCRRTAMKGSGYCGHHAPCHRGTAPLIRRIGWALEGK